MKGLRAWYHQLDMYDCARRLCTLLHARSASCHLERLFILDFYVATPSLLHGTKMKQDVRREFRSLKVPRPEKGYLTLPSARLLFHQMAPVQAQAYQSLRGKGLVEDSQADQSAVALTNHGVRVFESSLAQVVSTEEMSLVDFLVNTFSISLSEGIEELRASTGLRRVVR